LKKLICLPVILIMLSTLFSVLAFANADVSFDRLSADLRIAAEEHRRIIGGSVVSAHSEPYVLSLQSGGSHFCGAVLVSASRAITTASCMAGAGGEVYAVAGAHNIKQNESSQQTKQVSQVIMFPNYNHRTRQHDIAVLKLSGSFSLNNYVQTIALPSHRNNEWLHSGAQVRTCGWGNTRYPGHNFPATLHCVNVNIVSVGDCNRRNVYNGAILKGMQCAGVNGGGKDACQGDDGGPIKYNNQVVGLPSWGTGCALAQYPGVFTDVAQYRNWIDGEM